MVEKKYKKIVKKLIERDFPELKKEIIFVREAGKNFKFSAGITYLFLFSRLIVSRKFRNYPDEVIEAVFAHELGHLSNFKSYGFFKYIWRGFRYLTCKKIRLEEEYIADKISIDRGHARGLYKFRQEYWNPYKYKDYYLSPNEIKKYAKEIGKW